MRAKERQWQDPGEIGWGRGRGRRTGRTRGHREFERTVSAAQSDAGRKELKPPKGNEAERRSRKAGPGTGKGNRIEGTFFFFSS